MQQKVIVSGLWMMGKQRRPFRGMTFKPKLEQQDAGMMSISAEAAGQGLTHAMAQMLFSPRGSSPWVDIRQTLHLQACFWAKLNESDICSAGLKSFHPSFSSLCTLHWCLSLYPQITHHLLLLSTTHLVLHVSYTMMQWFSNSSTENPTAEGLEPMHMAWSVLWAVRQTWSIWSNWEESQITIRTTSRRSAFTMW